MSTKEITEEEIEFSSLIDKSRELILFNDDVNTFEHVIETLIRVCNHEPLQAEQCAMLVHYKGKCAVKTGSFTELKPLCSALSKADLSAEIQ